jgi:hypothetical protein
LLERACPVGKRRGRSVTVTKGRLQVGRLCRWTVRLRTETFQGPPMCDEKPRKRRRK